MENYFWNTEEHEEKTIYLLVIYDIVSNKRRNAFAIVIGETKSEVLDTDERLVIL